MTHPIFKSAVVWQSEPGEIYFIHVRGGNDQGSFGFELVELSDDDTPTIDNKCDDAATVELNDSTPTIGLGSESSLHVVPPDCSAPDMIGVWYRLVGQTDDAVVVATCGLEAETAVADLSIFTGSDCDKFCTPAYFLRLPCPDGQFGTTVIFNADPSTEYYIHVQIKEDADGMYQLRSFSVPDFAPSNDRCENAMEVQVGNGVITGSNVLGELDLLGAFRPTCFTANYAAGLGYV